MENNDNLPLENPLPKEGDNAILEHNEDEIFKAFMRRYGVLIAAVVIVIIGFLGFTKSREIKISQGKELSTQYLNEFLPELKDNNFDEARKKCETIINNDKTKDSPLSFAAKFLIVKTYIIEAQQQLAEKGTPPNDALKKVNDFIADNKKTKIASEKNILNFAYLAKGCLLEDLGRFEEARTVYNEELESTSTAYKSAADFITETELNKRKNLWTKRLESLKTP